MPAANPPPEPAHGSRGLPPMSPPPTSSSSGRRPSRRGGPIVAGLVLAWLLATEPFLAIVWDEGYTLGRIERIRHWFLGLASPATLARTFAEPPIELVQRDGDPPPGRPEVVTPRRDQLTTRTGLFDPPVLLYFWPFAREEPHGHPPFYALIGLIGDAAMPWREPLARARLGTMLAFSLATGWLFSFLDRRRGRWAALAAAGAMALQPRLFAHAHYALYDGLLTAMWVGAILAFTRAVERAPEDEPPRRTPRWPWVAAFGAILGAAMATKLTGWLIPAPFVVWTLIYRDRRGLLTLLAGGLVAAVVCYALVPPWWADPLDGVRRFLASNLGRAKTIPISTMFLGTIYESPNESVPWYSPPAITAMVTPVGFLLLALTGVLAVLRRFGTDRFGVLVLGNWAFLILLRAMPHVPAHNNERLFLPAFGCLAIAAGIGAGWLAARSARWARVVVGASLIEGLVSVLVMMPVPLSYYSPLVGGLKGAAAIGMEPTYYWDAFRPEASDWLNDHTGPSEKVAFSSFPTSFLYLRRIGQLRPAVTPGEEGRWAWYVLQNHSGNHEEHHRMLIRFGHPAYTYGKLGVPLLWIYPMAEYEEIIRTIRAKQAAQP